MLGMCPTLAVTTSAKNGIGMGLATMVILTASNLMTFPASKNHPGRRAYDQHTSLLWHSFVTIVEFLMEGLFRHSIPPLGIYIPLIVVNCIHPGTRRGICWKTWSDPVFI